MTEKEYEEYQERKNSTPTKEQIKRFESERQKYFSIEDKICRMANDMKLYKPSFQDIRKYIVFSNPSDNALTHLEKWIDTICDISDMYNKEVYEAMNKLDKARE